MASRFENGESITCEANNAVLDHYQEQPQRESVNLAVLCKSLRLIKRRLYVVRHTTDSISLLTSSE